MAEGYDVFVCEADADAKIVSTSLDLAGKDNIKNVAVVVDDTDITIMLL